MKGVVIVEYSNITKMSFDELVNMLSKTVSNKKKMIISSITSLILLIIVILNWDKDMLAAYILMTILVGIGFVLSILLIIMDKWIIKKSNKSLSNGVTYTYNFMEKEFSVTSLTNEKKRLTFKYSSLSKVKIDAEKIYLFPTPVSIYCVKLNGFSSAEDKESVVELLKPYTLKKGGR